MPHSTTTAPLTFYNVRKRIAKRLLLDIKKFTIPRSSCMFLSGNNGTGKTTLLKIISGLITPDHAEVYYKNNRQSWSAAQSYIQRDIIYLHQMPYIFDGSVTDNIAYGLHCRGYSATEVKDRVNEALCWAGLSHYAKQNARQLSGGERQRVVLSRAWVLKPHILLLDEPLTSLDVNARMQTISLIDRLRTEGMGIVVTGHDLQANMSIATEHLHLQQGKLFPIEELSDNRLLMTQKNMLLKTPFYNKEAEANNNRSLQGLH